MYTQIFNSEVASRNQEAIDEFFSNHGADTKHEVGMMIIDLQRILLTVKMEDGGDASRMQHMFWGRELGRIYNLIRNLEPDRLLNCPD